MQTLMKEIFTRQHYAKMNEQTKWTATIQNKLFYVLELIGFKKITLFPSKQGIDINMNRGQIYLAISTKTHFSDKFLQLFANDFPFNLTALYNICAVMTNWYTSWGKKNCNTKKLKEWKKYMQLVNENLCNDEQKQLRDKDRKKIINNFINEYMKSDQHHVMIQISALNITQEQFEAKRLLCATFTLQVLDFLKKHQHNIYTDIKQKYYRCSI